MICCIILIQLLIINSSLSNFKYKDEYKIMIKPKQPLGKIISTNNQFINIVSNKNPTTRKPSLPIRRSSSAQSAYSDQSCMSDRVVYSQNKKNNNLEI